MAVRPIVEMGAPVLRARAEPVADPGSPAIRTLAEDMVETMLEAPGVGLAAPQVGVGVRLIVYRVPSRRRLTGEPPGPVDPVIVVNPRITVVDATEQVGREGCLSIPGLVGEVPRAARITLTGLDLDGRPLTRAARGFHARVIQHEVDHLDGVLYIDRMRDLRSLAFERVLIQMAAHRAAPAATQTGT